MTNPSALCLLDWVTIAVFFTVMVAVGAYYGRRTFSSQFFGDDRSVPWWLSGVSFWMNTFSALAFVMYSALAYKFGYVAIALSWVTVPFYFFIGRIIAPRWRRAATKSPIDYISVRYTPGMCRFMAVLGLPMQLLDNALKLLAIGTVVGVGMGFPIVESIAVSGAIIIIYTFLGGLKAALACDFIQFFVILALLVALPFISAERLAQTDGGTGIVCGIKALLAKAPPGFFSSTADKYDWVYIAVFIVMCICTSSTNWSLVQRYYSTRSEKDAKKVVGLVTVLYIITPVFMYFPAMAARVFMPGLPESEMNGVYAALCREVLPTGAMGLVIAAMFSATMSSLAGNFNAIATVVVGELPQRLSQDAASRRRLGRIATVVVGLSVIGLTFAMKYIQGADDLFNLSNKVFGVFIPAISIPMLAGLFVRRFSKRSGMFAMLCGMAFGLVFFSFGGKWPFIREITCMFPATAVVTVICLFVGTRLFRDTPSERAGVDSFFAKLGKVS